MRLSGMRTPAQAEVPGPVLDLGLVLSGGSVNGILLQMGFLRALRERRLWERLGYVFGTSAGALSGWAAALDEIDEHERFLMEMQPEDVFAANDLWRTPLVGLHRYALPETVAARLGDPVELARRCRNGPRELTVVTTDIGLGHGDAEDPFERAFNSHTDTPEDFSTAVFASAAISTFVLPLRIGDGVYADGGWVRNFPLAYAYRDTRVQRIVGCRYRASATGFTGSALRAWHDRMSRLARLHLARGLTAELQGAMERQARGEPAHLVDTIARLSHIAVYRNSDLELQQADERDRSLAALDQVHEDVRSAIVASTRGKRRAQLLADLDTAFERADFPFTRGRRVPRLVVDLLTPPGVRLDITRRHVHWSDEDKRALIAHGYEVGSGAIDAWLAEEPLAQSVAPETK